MHFIEGSTHEEHECAASKSTSKFGSPKSCVLIEKLRDSLSECNKCRLRSLQPPTPILRAASSKLRTVTAHVCIHLPCDQLDPLVKVDQVSLLLPSVIGRTLRE